MKKVLIVLAICVIVICGLGSYMVRMQASRTAQASTSGENATVSRGDVIVKVVETGTIDAVKSVEVKSRTDGRLAKLLVDEGDHVTQGQLIALIDPKQTQLRVEQDQANLQGAESGAAKAKIELDQRRVTARRDYQQAQLKLAELRDQLKVQPTLTNAGIAQAKADLASAIQERDRLKASILPNERKSAETSKRQAEANYANAESQYNRQMGLRSKGYVSTKDVEDARMTLQVQEANLDEAKNSYDRIDQQIQLEQEKADESVRHAQAALDSALAGRIQDVNKRRDFELAVADVEKARVALRDVDAMEKSYEQSRAQVRQLGSVLGDSQRNLGETFIRSPLDGIVTKKEVQEGELVASLSSFSSGTGIVRIEDRRSLRVVLDVNEIDVAKMLEGMKATVEVDALPDQKFEGVIKRIAPASTNVQAATTSQTATDTVVKYQVEVYLTSTNPHLRSGMSAKCTFEVEHKHNVLKVPLEYVGKDDKGKYVLLAPAKGSKAEATRVAVKAGTSTGSEIEIISGVNEGQEIQKPKFAGPQRQGFMQAGGD